jgi:acyl carrier protein
MQTLEHFGLEEAFQCIFEDVNAAKLRNLQGSIEMIKEESR